MIVIYLFRVNYFGEFLEEILVLGIDLIYMIIFLCEGYVRLEWLDC